MKTIYLLISFVIFLSVAALCSFFSILSFFYIGIQPGLVWGFNAVCFTFASSYLFRAYLIKRDLNNGINHRPTSWFA